MDRLVYVLNSNVFADYANQIESTITRLKQTIVEGHDVFLCQPVRYEILRGLIKTNATRKRRLFEEQFVSQLAYTALTDADWEQAASFWAQMRNQGKQFSDIDLLIAAITVRLNCIVVTSDDDFSPLSIKRENWRKP